jgi:hypothetical protein
MPVEKDEFVETITKARGEIHVKELKLKEAELDVKLKSYNDVLNPTRPKMQTMDDRYRALVKNEDDVQLYHFIP